ncbi:hypothetical protein [Rhodococcus qingshengii]|uniref:Uncharacterized protein n=1 Tax=Rhodococcus qingshengii TaxID=334542 RepID=A0A2A5J3H0_RHOSG|nr:hypothetical protein [Rhodococcus qingshengii]PCK24135.1 hypothetical protein CHR55_27220 [Rhodococcus qingshengii]
MSGSIFDREGEWAIETTIFLDGVCQQGDACIVLTGHTDYDFDPDDLLAGDHPVVHETDEMCTYITLPKVRQS